MKGKLADSEERVRSSEQAYAALKEKAQSDEASHLELISKMGDKVHSYDVAYASLVSQAQEKARSDEAAFRELVSKAEEKFQLDGAAHATLVLQMEEKIEASETAYSELARKMEECERALKDRESVTLTAHSSGVCWTERYIGPQLSSQYDSGISHMWSLPGDPHSTVQVMSSSSLTAVRC